jgi:REP element-mobilizing transposase RayT
VPVITARKPRLHIPSALYLVILRGNAKQDIFFSARDRTFFCSLLGHGIARFGYLVHALCLMRNHVHLALQSGERTLSEGMQTLVFVTRAMSTACGPFGLLRKTRLGQTHSAPYSHPVPPPVPGNEVESLRKEASHARGARLEAHVPVDLQRGSTRGDCRSGRARPAKDIIDRYVRSLSASTGGHLRSPLEKASVSGASERAA